MISIKFLNQKSRLASFLLCILLFSIVGSMTGLNGFGDGMHKKTLNFGYGIPQTTQAITPPTLPISSRGLRVTGAVAILEDADPWGYNDVETILLTYPNMVVDTIPSASFGTSLGKYQKVIISSNQNAAFYTAVESNRTWLENYVSGGGTLEIHAARQYALGDWILPGGFGHIVNGTNNVDIADSGHYLLHNPLTITEVELEGWNDAAHGYFNNTSGNSIILTDGAGEPVLIEARFGLGYIIATTQPVEWGYGLALSNFLENVVWYIPTLESPTDGALTGPVAILQNLNPWAYNASQQILTNLSISYDIIPSANFGTTDLSSYQKVIIASVQSFAFYTALANNRTWLENYVNNGGILEVHAATQGWNWVLPGGAGFTWNMTDNINILEPLHPTLHLPYRIWEPELEYWFWSTHGYFNDTTGATLILDDGSEAVFFENVTGDGLIIATGQTVEWAWAHNYSMFLENLIRYVPQPPSVTVTYPNGGETLSATITITWDAFDPNDDTLTFDLDYWNGTSWVSLAIGYSTTSYLWDTTTVPNGADYRVRVTVDDGTWTTTDESDAVFAIQNIISLPPLPWWWWIVGLAVIIIIVIILICLLMRRRGASSGK